MSDDALIRLGKSTSEAISGVLEMFAAGKVSAGEVSVIPAEANPMDSLALPAVATNVSYIDGVTGGNVFVMTLDGARKLAAAMMGMEQPEDPDAPELSELELSAVSEAMNQMMASAAIAISSVLGTDVEIGTPETKTFSEQAEALDVYPKTPHAVRANFTVCGEPCRLIQLVPNAFVVRMTRGARRARVRGDAAVLDGRFTGRRAPGRRRCRRRAFPVRHPRPRVGRARPHPDAVRPGGRHAVRLGGRAQPSCGRAD